MIERSADAWEHNQFKDVIVRVANVEMWVSQKFRILLSRSNPPGPVITRPCRSICKSNRPF